MEIRIVASHLPGRACPGSPGFPRYENIHVAIQRRGRPKELLGVTAGDAPSVVWTLPCEVVGARSPGFDIKGPYIQGPRGGRFLYVTWGTVDEGSAFDRFRRAKLWLDAIDADTLDRARQS